MQFALFFNQPKDELKRQADPETSGAALGPWFTYMDDMAKAGIMRGGSRLAPPWAAKTVRAHDGAVQVSDGPFAAAGELVAGYVVIEVDSMEQALHWAGRSPSTGIGSTEVRPVL